MSARLSVVVPVFNDADGLVRCLTAIAGSDFQDYECLVVDDGSTVAIAPVVAPFRARVIRVDDGPKGPAHARNIGSASATGDILVFVDADVVIAPGTLRAFADSFDRHPDAAAVFGSYDDAPATTDFVSQYKNLFHHFVHQHASEEAATFWSGCGAIRRTVFHTAGGFDAVRYPRPCIEDIELGYRLRAAGHRILLNKHIQVKHLKRWTLRGMVKTDVFDRGVPWTQLILERRRLPNDLNLQFTQRLSAMLAYSMLVYVALAAFFHNIVLLPLIAGLFIMVVAAMDWSSKSPLFHLNSRRSEWICYGLIAVIGALAVALDELRMLPPLAVLLTSMVAGRWLRATGWFGRRLLLVFVVGALATIIVVLLSRFSFPIVAPLLAAALLIVLLNFRLYLFFIRTRGHMFALAALSMHLFYFSYALASLLIGVAMFVRGSRNRDQAAAGAA